MALALVVQCQHAYDTLWMKQEQQQYVSSKHASDGDIFKSPPVPGLPTVDQINRALAESGERERLKALLKTRLAECGWNESLKTECHAELDKRGVDRIGPHELASLLGPKAKGISSAPFCKLIQQCVAAIPEEVKEAVLREIGAFLDKLIVISDEPQQHSRQ